MGEEIDELDFRECIDLFEYWADYPPLHLMVRAYLGYESKTAKPSDFEQMQAVHVLAGPGRAEKVSRAPIEVQQRFATLKDAEKKLADARR